MNLGPQSGRGKGDYEQGAKVTRKRHQTAGRGAACALRKRGLTLGRIRALCCSMTRSLILAPFLTTLFLSACSDVPLFKRDRAGQTVSGDTIVAGDKGPSGPFSQTRPPLRPGENNARGADDGVSGTDRAALAGTLRGDLGATIASLGNASEPGIWLKTPLVKVDAPGKVSFEGKTVSARLIPIQGPTTAGSRASLQLMQALGAPLTGLPELRVSR